MSGFAYGSTPSPFGARLCVASNGTGLVCSAFASREGGTLAALVERYGPRQPADAIVRDALHQARAYFARRLRRFDLPLALTGTPFQVAVWQTVAQLDAGIVVSYAEVAHAVAHPRAHRGVAAAMAKTPLDLFVPAHRVIGADGRLKGARGKTQMRRRLLLFEGIRLPR